MDVSLLKKFKSGGLYGYLTDSECLQLLNKLRTAEELSKELEAGAAVTQYFMNEYFRIEQVCRARGLKLP